MKVEAIDHVNIRTPDVAGTSRFFAEVLSMEIRESPGTPDMSRAAWLCDTEGRAVIHLASKDVLYPGETTATMAAPGSGRIHHVALCCSGYEEMSRRLTEQGRAFHANEIPQVGLRQIFIQEPNGITLELNFFNGEIGSL